MSASIHVLKPETVDDCAPGGKCHVRPCPWVRCKYHLLIQQYDSGGVYAWRSADERGPGKNPDVLRDQVSSTEIELQRELIDRLRGMPYSCALDVVRDELQAKPAGDALGIGTFELRTLARQGIDEIRKEMGNGQ
jgi:hypothetical protein